MKASKNGLYEKKFTYNGKRYSVYGRTELGVIEKAAAKKALLEAGVREASGDQTVERWAYTWLKDYKNGIVSEAWYDNLEGYIRNYIVPELGKKRVRDVKPIDIIRMLNKHADKSESVGKALLQVTKQIFDAAEENDLIIKDPAKRVKLPRYRPKVEHRTITSLERDLTLRAAAKHPEDGLFFLIMLYCGCRPQEVAALRMSDVDLEKDILHINKARKPDDTIERTKTPAGVRDVPIPQPLHEYLASLDKKPEEFVITNTRGEMITRSSQKRLWTRFRRDMELEYGTKVFRNALVDPILPDDFVPYCYRHTYCTDLQDAGVPLVVASRLMGHADIKVTAKIYTHASEASFENARDKINDFTQFSTTLLRHQHTQIDPNTPHFDAKSGEEKTAETSHKA